jgi:hypothetical protein
MPDRTTGSWTRASCARWAGLRCSDSSHASSAVPTPAIRPSRCCGRASSRDARTSPARSTRTGSGSDRHRSHCGCYPGPCACWYRDRAPRRLPEAPGRPAGDGRRSAAPRVAAPRLSARSLRPDGVSQPLHHPAAGRQLRLEAGAKRAAPTPDRSVRGDVEKIKRFVPDAALTGQDTGRKPSAAPRAAFFHDGGPELRNQTRAAAATPAKRLSNRDPLHQYPSANRARPSSIPIPSEPRP